jgi:hypothetical protein
VRRRLPVRIESPCQEDWSAMTPRGEGRHCARCESTVIDMTRMTRAHAVAIAREQGGKVCGRVRANARGEAVFAPEPSPFGLVPVALAGLLAACAPDEAAQEPADVVVAVTDAPRAIDLSAPQSGSFGGSLATGVMMPIGPEAIAPPPPSVVAAPCAVDEPVEPTPEQIALTRRKHARQHAQHSWRQPPMMGMMVLHD